MYVRLSSSREADITERIQSSGVSTYIQPTLRSPNRQLTARYGLILLLEQFYRCIEVPANFIFKQIVHILRKSIMLRKYI